MGLRCLIGHDYGDPQTERDRREQGREVVVTVREFRECSRCGHRRVISENKEVTAEPPDESDPAPDADQLRSPDDATAEGSSPDQDLDGSPDTEEPMSADEDDGVILEDEAEGPPRAHGEWPASDHEESADLEEDHEPWPDESHPAAAEPADGGPSPEPSTDTTAEPAESSTTDGAVVESADEVDAPTAAAPGDPPEPEPEPPAEPDRPTPQPDPSDTELVCPDCEETWPSVNASLRPGDICPECRRGYLEEQLLQ